jgi:hypothetical protein
LRDYEENKAEELVWVACYHTIFLLLVEKHIKAAV